MLETNWIQQDDLKTVVETRKILKSLEISQDFSIFKIFRIHQDFFKMLKNPREIKQNLEQNTINTQNPLN